MDPIQTSARTEGSRRGLEGRTADGGFMLRMASFARWKPLDLLNALTPRGRSETTAGIAFGADPRQRLDVHRPHGGGPRAAVVFFYGGSWQSGERGDYAFAGRALAARGFVAVVPDYRTYPPHRFPAFLEDAALALRWTRDHARELGVDPRRIFPMGHSAGAHIVAMLAVDRRWTEAAGIEREAIRAAIGLAGPYDFLPLRDPNLKELFGPEGRLAETQPVNHVRGGEPPMLLLHGAADRTVGPRNSRRLAARLRDQGGEVEEVFYPRVGHAGILAALAPPFRWWAPVLRDVARFVEAR